MEINRQELTVLDRDSDPTFYFKNLTDDKLVKTVENLEDYDDVSSALTELSVRNRNDEVTKHTFKILRENLGDEFLQATAFNLLYDNDVQKAVRIVEIRNSDALSSLLGEIMNSLASNSLQPFESSLSKEFLKSIVSRFSDFDSESQENIYDDYEYFVENYKNKLS